MTSYTDPPKIYAQVTRRISDGNYGSYEITLGVSNLPFNATEDEILDAINGGQNTLKTIGKAVRDKVAEIRKEL